MITPSPATLRRRSRELSLSGQREAIASDLDSSALLKFYAAECGLKCIYMERNGLKDTDEARGGKSSARSFGHGLPRLVDALSISPREVPRPPSMKHRRSGDQIQAHETHEGWRYGEKIENTTAFSAWLDRILEWIEKQK